MASPLAKKTAAEGNVDLKGVQGSGPNNRIIKSDVDAAKASAPSKAAAPQIITPAGTLYEDFPLTNIRKVILNSFFEYPLYDIIYLH